MRVVVPNTTTIDTIDKVDKKLSKKKSLSQLDFDCWGLIKKQIGLCRYESIQKGKKIYSNSLVCYLDSQRENLVG
jgi:hypothetical protein